MTLHARTVQSCAGATADIFETVVEQLIDDGDIKVWKAKEIVESLRTSQKVEELQQEVIEYLPELATAHGKVILLGEHAVVYDSHAIAAPIPLAIQARIHPGKNGVIC